MAKRKRRGRRKGSRKHAMPHKKRRRGRRARNATLGAGAQIALGVGGYITAGLLGSLAQAYLLPATSSANTIRLTRSAVGAVGALGTAMLVGEPTMSGPLATGMAANAGVQILGVGADAAGITVSNKKFMGLAPGSTDAAVSTTMAATKPVIPASSTATFPALIVVWDASTYSFKDSAGNIVQGGSAGTRTIKDAAGNTGTLELLGTVKNGQTYVFVSSDGSVWVRDAQGSVDTIPAATLSLNLSTPVAALAGTFPPWAGYPGYDKRRFPQQAVSLPAQIAPHVQGYANYAPAMSGYANFAPAMAGWDPGYGG